MNFVRVLCVAYRVIAAVHAFITISGLSFCISKLTINYICLTRDFQSTAASDFTVPGRESVRELRRLQTSEISAPRTESVRELRRLQEPLPASSLPALPATAGRRVRGPWKLGQPRQTNVASSSSGTRLVS